MSSELASIDPQWPSQPVRQKAMALYLSLENQFITDGTFWDRGNAAAGSDENFSWKDFFRGLLTVPDMRWWMILGQCWNLITPKWPKQGLTEAFIANRKYNFRFRSIFTDGLILESLRRAQKQFDITPGAGFISASQAMVDSLFAEAYFDNLPKTQSADKAFDLRLYSYYPKHGHRVPETDPVYDLFFKTGKNVPDSDSTCTIYCAMRSLIDSLQLDAANFPITSKELDPLIHFLHLHIRGSGQYGQKLPSYDPGVGDLTGAVAIWYKESFNEFEPFANINILQFCFLMYDRLGEKARTEARDLAQSITGFLCRHALKGSFSNPRFNFYYPLSVGFYLWWRCLETHADLPKPSAEFFGVGENLQTIDLALQQIASDLFEKSPEKTNRFDRGMAAPYLFSKKMGLTQLGHDVTRGLHLEDPLFQVPHTLFRMWYPSKILGMPEKLSVAAALDLLTLVDKSSKI